MVNIMSFIKNSNKQVTKGYLWSFFGAYLRPGNLGSIATVMRQTGEISGENRPNPAALGCHAANDQTPSNTGISTNDTQQNTRAVPSP